MDTLRELTAKAANEIRSPNGPGPHTRALANYFSSLITTIVGTSSVEFDHARWLKIVQAMGVNGGEIGEDLLLWIAGLGGEISLLLIGHQQQVPKEHLERNILAFCDAVDIVDT